MSRRSGGAAAPTAIRHRDTLVSAAIGLLLWTTLASAAPGPTVLLFGANLDQARSFAVDSAREHGWRLVSMMQEAVIVEQVLEESPQEDRAPLRVIRVRARFTDEGAGVRVELSAAEVESPGRPEEWSEDVTDRYGLNLANALSSLRTHWDERRSPSSPGTGDPAPVRYPTPAPPAPTTDPTGNGGPVGTWAYYAERYAEGVGCVLAEGGARLEAAGADWERHRVPCRNRAAVRVHCRFGDCTGTPSEVVP